MLLTFPKKETSSLCWDRFRWRRRLLFLPVIGIFIIFLLTFRPERDLLSHNTSLHPEARYLLQKTYLKYDSSSTEYKIAVVSDMDKKSKIDKENTWRAILKEGLLIRDPTTRKYSVTWTKEYELKSKYNEGGRGLELSELVYYNDKLLTCDDRTGIIFEITKDHLMLPRYIVTNGDGNKDKGFKCEWMTVKNDLLWIGSLGKEWTNDKGIIENFDPMWVKTIDRDGRIRHINWTDRYEFLRAKTNTKYPGYLIHEAVGWNVIDKEWIFLPRRKSEEEYNDILDEERGANVMLIVSEDFNRFEMKTIGSLRPTHGFSSFKFIPWREHEIVALKTEEYRDTIATYIMVFDKETGEILMDETLLSNETKFEGIEFV